MYSDGLFDIRLLAKAVVLAGLVQLGLCLFAAWKAGLLPHFAHRFQGKAMRVFLALMLPGVMSGLFLQINFLTNRAFASTLTEGSIAWLFYAERLFSLPLALIGISLGIALLPMLSRAISTDDQSSVEILTRQSVQAALFWSLPAAVGLVLCADWVIAVLFERGAFLPTDTHRTALALQMLALGLPAYILSKVLQPLFFARHNTRTPMLISLMVMAINVGLSLMLMPWLAHVGLALAAAISGWVQVMILYVRLGDNRPKASGMGRFIVGVVTACVLMALVVWGLKWAISQQDIGQQITGWLAVSLLLVVVAVAVIVYVVAASRLSGYSWQRFKGHPEP